MLPQEFYQLPVDNAILLLTCLDVFVLEKSNRAVLFHLLPSDL